MQKTFDRKDSNIAKQPMVNQSKLSRRQRRDINAAIARARSDVDRSASAQSSIPYLAMYRDGVCMVTEKLYSKTLEFSDASYALASDEGKTAVFDRLCSLYNYFDPSVHVQETYVSKMALKDDLRGAIQIPVLGGGLRGISEEYGEILKAQNEKGNNGFVGSKYFTFAIETDSLKSARARLGRIEADVIGLFRQMGVSCKPLDGKARLSVMHGIFHLGTADRFVFDWKDLPGSGLSTKDYISPSSLRFGDSSMFGMGGMAGSAGVLQIIAPELNDRVLADFLEVDSNSVVSIHIRSIDHAKAVKMVKRKLTDIDSMKITEQKKAVRGGYDMDLLPSDLNTYGEEAKKLLRELQNRNERMFMLTVTVINIAGSKQALDNRVFQMSGIAQKHNCSLIRLDYMQEQGLMSCLPLGQNLVPVERALTTSGAAIFIPFITRELFQGGEALYYGCNALSGNMIMADRKLLKNPNGLILGIPGSGKSFSAKREIVNVFLITKDFVIICDPESEYAAVVLALGGQVIRLSSAGDVEFHINPMDISPDYSEGENPVALKVDFLLSFFEVIVKGRGKLLPIEKTLIDRAVRRVYGGVLSDAVKSGGRIEPDKMPVLEDLYRELCKMDEREAKDIAAVLDLYVHGSLNIFNHRTNVDIGNRLVCYDIKGLGSQLKTLGMLVVQDQIWNRVSKNRDAKVATRYYCDEFHLLLKDELGAWSVEMWKRFRKWGGIPTGITQNVKDLLASREIENIFENSDFVYMLSQAPGDREILAEKLGISPRQLAYVTQAEAGEGLIFYGNAILPFVDRFPRDTGLYRLMTTKLEESVG